MKDFEINLAAEIVVDSVLQEDVDLMSVREILESEREEWVFFDRDDQPHTLDEETEEEAEQIRARVREILEALRDRVEMVSRDA
jgi:hypothetical protein